MPDDEYQEHYDDEHEDEDGYGSFSNKSLDMRSYALLDGEMEGKGAMGMRGSLVN